MVVTPIDFLTESSVSKVGNGYKPSFVPPRHLMAIQFQIRLEGIPITGRVIWSALFFDEYDDSRHPMYLNVAGLLGYGDESMTSYACHLLIMHNIDSNNANVQLVKEALIEQIDVYRSAVFVPDEQETSRLRFRGTNFDRWVKLELVELGNETVYWDSWASDDLVKEYVETCKTEYSLSTEESNEIYFRILRGSLLHRQKYIELNPGLQQSIQKIINSKKYQLSS
jgi:hypothetical protein